jgi:malonate transporter
VTLALGFFAGWRHEFFAEQTLVLNQVVLLHALPLLLFAGTVTIKRGTLTNSLGAAAIIITAMVGAYLITFLVVRFALTALAIGGPAIPFAGVVVLGYLYGPSVSAEVMQRIDDCMLGAVPVAGPSPEGM